MKNLEPWGLRVGYATPVVTESRFDDSGTCPFRGRSDCRCGWAALHGGTGHYHTHIQSGDFTILRVRSVAGGSSICDVRDESDGREFVAYVYEAGPRES